MTHEDRMTLLVIADELEEAGNPAAEAIREIAGKPLVLGKGQVFEAALPDYVADWFCRKAEVVVHCETAETRVESSPFDVPFVEVTMELVGDKVLEQQGGE